MKGQEEKTLAASGRTTGEPPPSSPVFPAASATDSPPGVRMNTAAGEECAILPGAARAWRFVMAYKTA